VHLVTYFLLLVLPFLRPLFEPDNTSAYLGFVSFNLFGAWLVADTGRSILAHPFSYTLPGHLANMRLRLLTIGLACNALFVLPMLMFPSPGLGKLEAIVSVYFAGLALYLGATLVVFRVPGAGKWGSALAILAIVQNLPAVVVYRFLGNVAELTFHGSLLFFVVAASLLLVAFWRLLSQREMNRQLLATPDLAFVESFDHARVAEHKVQQLMEQRSRQRDAGTGVFDTELARRAGRLFCFRQQLLLTRHRFKLQRDSIHFWHLLVFALALLLFIEFSDRGYALMMSFFSFFFLFFNLEPIDREGLFLPYARVDLVIANVLMGLVYSLYCVLFGLVLWPVIVLVRDPLLLQPVDWSDLAGLAFNFLLAPCYLAIKLTRRSWVSGASAGLIGLMMAGNRVLYESFSDDYVRANVATLVALHLAGWLIYLAAVHLRYGKYDLA
jgi:hypothetical protein